MRKITKILLKFLFVTLIVHCTFYIVHSPAYAKDFSSIYKSTYEFDDKGVVYITQEVSLINNSSDKYASQYGLNIIGNSVYDVEAFDKIGPIKTDIEKKENSVLITLTFNEKSVGKDKIMAFILKYKSTDFAKKEGNLWQITLPKLSNSSDIDEYSTVLKIPSAMGKLSNINPPPVRVEDDQKYKYYYFDKDKITKYGVLANFGQYQTFDFEIKYSLQNPSNDEIIQEIPIPPDTNYQQMNYNSIIPNPIDVEIDGDGNWIASFLLKPKQNIDIKAIGFVNIFSSPRNDYKEDNLSYNNYKLPSQFWITKSPEIISLAEKLKTPEAIYKYVVENLNYNYDLIEKKSIRKNSTEILKDPNNSVCSDFSDLFVAIARAANIPAREVQGYAYTDNPKLQTILETSDVLHSWPEYFDAQKNQWIMIDPTYGNTTNGLDFFNQFDMTHFVFVIHGKDPQYPVPPGSYKLEGNKEKQISVIFGKEDLSNIVNVDFVSQAPKTVFSLVKNPISLKITNKGGGLIFNQKVLINGKADIFPKEVLIERLPPYGVIDANYSLKPFDFWKDYELSVDYKIKDNVVSEKFLINSLLFRSAIGGGIIIALILFFLLRSIFRGRKSVNVIASEPQ